MLYLQLHVLAQVVVTSLTFLAEAARHARFNGNTVTNLEVLNVVTNGNYNTSGLVAEYHRSLELEVTNSTVKPIVNI
jgi:hypothetical protein